MKNPKMIPKPLLEQIERAKAIAEQKEREQLQRELDLFLFVISLAEASPAHDQRYGIDGTYTARFNACVHDTTQLLDLFAEHPDEADVFDEEVEDDE